AVRGRPSRPAARSPLLSVLRRGYGRRHQAAAGNRRGAAPERRAPREGRIRLLEGNRLGEDDARWDAHPRRYWLPLPGSVGTDPLLREGKASALGPRHTRRAARPALVRARPRRETQRRGAVADPAEQRP